MDCPNCKKINLDDATKCECGYVFKGYKESSSPDITASRSHTNDSNNQNVTVTDIKMPFGSMVEFMVKWAIASIPAFIILFLIGMMVMGVFGVGIATLFK